MNDLSGFFAAGIIFAIFIVIAVLVLWRMRKHVSSRADAEARMAAAMQELQILAARLQGQKGNPVSPEQSSSDDRRDVTSST
jgi:membrane protein implicated in regulation of membrane protease activity